MRQHAGRKFSINEPGNCLFIWLFLCFKHRKHLINNFTYFISENSNPIADISHLKKASTNLVIDYSHLKAANILLFWHISTVSLNVILCFVLFCFLIKMLFGNDITGFFRISGAWSDSYCHFCLVSVDFIATIL